jgi:hypothetical protein
MHMNFIEIGSGLQKLIGMEETIDTQRCRMTTFMFLNYESRLTNTTTVTIIRDQAKSLKQHTTACCLMMVV